MVGGIAAGAPALAAPGDPYINVSQSDTGERITDEVLGRISADGSTALLTSRSTRILPGADSWSDVHAYLREVASGNIVLIDRPTDGRLNVGGVGLVVMSSNAEFVAFTSSASNLDMVNPDGASGVGLYLWERATGEMKLVERLAAGDDAVFRVHSVNSAGTSILISTMAPRDPRDTDAKNADLYVLDVLSGQATWVPAIPVAAKPALQQFGSGALGEDGSVIFFTNRRLTPLDTNALVDAYLFEAPDSVRLVTRRADGTAYGLDTASPAVSADLSTIAYSTERNIGRDVNGYSDVYRIDVATGKRSWASRSIASLWSSQISGVSGDGSCLGLILRPVGDNPITNPTRAGILEMSTNKLDIAPVNTLPARGGVQGITGISQDCSRVSVHLFAWGQPNVQTSVWVRD